MIPIVRFCYLLSLGRLIYLVGSLLKPPPLGRVGRLGYYADYSPSTYEANRRRFPTVANVVEKGLN